MEFLRVSEAPMVTNLSAVEDLNLRFLGLVRMPGIEDLTPIEGLNLRFLTVQGTRIEELPNFSGKSMKFLALLGNEELRDISGLAGLEMEELVISGQISDLNPLLLAQIRMLEIRGTISREGCEIVKQLEMLGVEVLTEEVCE